MEIRTLRYFLAVANEENITRASEYLHVSQPTLSRQLMELEEEFGKQLLIRGKRKVTLTPDGVLLRNRAIQILDLIDKTSSDMTGNDNSVSGTIHIGAGETDGVRYVMQAARNLQEDYPDIHYNFFSGDGMSVIDHLDKGLIDFGLMFGNFDLNKYQVLELTYEDTWCVLMKADDELSALEAAGPANLADRPLILSRQSTEEGVMQTWFGCSLQDLNVFCIYNLVLNATKLVQDGLGYAIALDNLVPVDGTSGLVSRPLRPAMRDRLKLVWRKHQVLTPAAQLFLDQIRSL